ncbi:MAG: L-serine ammonia-lyase, iron-sulfur-dependent subunit beta [bacterium]|nr:L-serine ammonia-lyase, iron-sulfur-dependent subunit beta [bacterium]
MEEKSLFSVISPIMVGPSSSHTAGAVRLGLIAKNIYKHEFKCVKFILYNSYAETGFGHGTDKGLLAGLMGYSVDNPDIKNIFNIVKNIDYSFEYVQDISRHPNSVDIIIDNTMKLSGNSIGAGEVQITDVNDFSINIKGHFDTLVVMYKDKPGMISKVCDLIQKKNINIAKLYCDRDSKGGNASMCIKLDYAPDDALVNSIKQLQDVYYVTNVRKLVQ